MIRPIDANAMISNLEAMRDQLGYTAITLDGIIKGLRETPTVELSVADAVLVPPEEEPVFPEPKPKTPLTEAEEKRRILQRLKDYRDAHGRGCLAAVAKATRSRGRTNDTTLLGFITGDCPPMPIEDWRKVGAALDKLEQREAAPGE